MPPVEKTNPILTPELRAEYLRYVFGMPASEGTRIELGDAPVAGEQGSIKPKPVNTEWVLTKIMRTSDGSLDGNRFFLFNKQLSSSLSENERFQMLRFWLGRAGERYDKSNWNMSPAEEALALESVSASGMCTDINASFGSRLSDALGFRPARMVVWPGGDALGHVVLLLQDRGSGHKFLADYEKGTRLSDDWNTACEQVSAAYGKVVPYSLALEPSTAFYQPPSEKVLLKALGWYGDKVEEETGAKISSFDSDGSSTISFIKPVKNFTFACFALNTPFSLSQAYGARASLLLEDREGRRKEGILWLPQLDFAAMAAKTGKSFYDLEMLRLTPASYSLFPTDNFEVRAIPLKLELASSGLNLQPSGKAGSELGFIVHGDGFNQYYFKVLSAYGANPQRFYRFYNPSVAFGVEAGVVQGDTQVRAGYYPGAMIEQGKVEANKKFSLGNGVDFLMSGEVSFQDNSRVWRMGGQLSMRLP